MRRLIFWCLLCLPICLLLAPDRYRPVESSPVELSPDIPVEPTFAVILDDSSPLPDADAMERLAREDPRKFLEWCIRRCQREVKSARLTLFKHEVIDGQQRPPELIAVDYRVVPYGVLFHWLENPGLASSVLYSPEDLPEKLLVRPVGLLAAVGNVERDVRGDEARQSGRYSLAEFGFELAMRRTLGSWNRAARRGSLSIEYLGIQEIPELGGRRCYVLHRGNYGRAEEKDGVSDLTIYVDCETWLQTGSILKNSSGQILGKYFFSDVQINPPFRADRFTPKGLRRPPPAGI